MNPGSDTWLPWVRLTKKLLPATPPQAEVRIRTNPAVGPAMHRSEPPPVTLDHGLYQPAEDRFAALLVHLFIDDLLIGPRQAPFPQTRHCGVVDFSSLVPASPFPWGSEVRIADR